ncbi:MAG: ABC transporter permease [Phycisphaerales bacterium]|nr:ABC transporter permease [Phycisphaerales bacterium]
MGKIFAVARREYVSTVATKGFIIGVLILPAIMIAAFVLIPLLINDRTPALKGVIAVIDRTGWTQDPGVVSALRQAYAPETLRAEREAERIAKEAAAKAIAPAGPLGEKAAQAAAEQSVADLPEIAVESLAPQENLDAQVEALKARLRDPSKSDDRLLAVVVLDADAVHSDDATKPLGSYQLYLRTKLDDRFEQPLHGKVRQAIIGARMAAAGQDYAQVNRLMQVGPAPSTVVTEDGERKSSGAAGNFFLAMGFMLLMWSSVFTGGQYLMTTVIEEKSSRVMEVLLSAVSPMQLMTGKILGQMAVALSILLVYVVIGLFGLQRFNLLDLVNSGNLTLLVVYFIIAFFLIGAMMAAIGSAVTEMREAQAMLTPVMLVLMVPMILWMPLARTPNSAFATIISFVPPIGPFAMVIRMASTEGVPWWQHPVAIVTGALAVFGAIWLTAKIFRIGVLMYGKPPNLRTLIRWVRMA